MSEAEILENGDESRYTSVMDVSGDGRDVLEIRDKEDETFIRSDTFVLAREDENTLR